jgi:hypothetical protein
MGTSQVAKNAGVVQHALMPGRWFTIETAAEAYPRVLTPRLLRTLVARREIAFSKAGRRIVFSENDIESYLASILHENA